jgi:hypothetical protein
MNMLKNLAVPVLSLALAFTAACADSTPEVPTSKAAATPIKVGDEIPVPENASTWIRARENIEYVFSLQGDLDGNPETEDEYLEKIGLLATPDACLPRGGKVLVESLGPVPGEASARYLYNSVQYRQIDGRTYPVHKGKQGGSDDCPHGVRTTSLTLGDLYELRDGSVRLLPDVAF